MRLRNIRERPEGDFENRSLARFKHIAGPGINAFQRGLSHFYVFAEVVVLFVERIVLRHCRTYVTVVDGLALLEKQGRLAEGAHRRQVMRHEHQRGAVAGKLPHPGKTFFLKVVIAHA